MNPQHGLGVVWSGGFGIADWKKTLQVLETYKVGNISPYWVFLFPISWVCHSSFVFELPTPNSLLFQLFLRAAGTIDYLESLICATALEILFI